MEVLVARIHCNGIAKFVNVSIQADKREIDEENKI